MTALTNTPIAVFRADASAAIGGGHVTRCLSLSRALQALGWRCGFAVNAAAGETVPALRGETLQQVADTASLEPLRAVAADWLIVDHYGLDAAWEAAQRGWARRILVIDDLADRQHDCDVLLDQTFGRTPDEYDGLVPNGCRRLTGSDYALLRPAFAAARPASLARRATGGDLRRILVSLGATDPDNHSAETMRGIAASGLPVAVDVVLGSGARHLGAVRNACDSLPLEVRLHVDTPEMPQLMAAADLAIGAAGTSTWERCCLGLPSLLVVIAENQRRIAGAVSATGAARLLPGPRPALAEQVAAALRDLAADAAALRDLGQRAAAICDGRGCDRVGLALVEPGRAKDGRRVSLRLAAPADEPTLLAWQSHPTTRRFARNPAVPTAQEHHRWFAARLADPGCLLTIITLDGAPAGMLRLDPIAPVATAPEAPAFEVSILVAPDHRGLRIAQEALSFLRRWQGAAVIAAEVLAGNEPSAALFRAAGYTPGADGLLYSLPAASAASLIH